MLGLTMNTSMRTSIQYVSIIASCAIMLGAANAQEVRTSGDESSVGKRSQELSINAEVEKLEALKSVPTDSTAARKQFGQVFLLAQKIKKDSPLLADILTKSALAGLISIGDLTTYSKTKHNLADCLAFEGRLSQSCEQCNGNGFKEVACRACDGKGKCPVSSCSNGIRTMELLTTGGEKIKCAHCNGTGRCKQCNGRGKTSVACSYCNGKKGYFNKSLAARAYGVYLDIAINLYRGITTNESDLLPLKVHFEENPHQMLATKGIHAGTQESGSGPTPNKNFIYKGDMNTFKGPRSAHSSRSSTASGRSSDDRIVDHKPVIIRKQVGAKTIDIVIDDGRE